MNMKDKELEAIKLKHVNNNTKIYHENSQLLSLYDQYINNIVELFDYIKNNESDFFFTIVFDILIEIGFFTTEGKFNFQNDHFKELSIKPGINIISGEGVCRNLACFYSDIFSYFCNYPLTTCCFDEKGSHNEDAKLYGNHVINLTSYNDIMYGFDITNHCAFIPSVNNSLKGINYDYLLTYAPSGDILLQLTTLLDEKKDIFKEINEKRKLLIVPNDKQVMTKEDFNKIVSDANSFIINRKKILQSFIVENNELTHEIKKKMLLLK